jgi:hypothetical protein
MMFLDRISDTFPNVLIEFLNKAAASTNKVGTLEGRSTAQWKKGIEIIPDAFHLYSPGLGSIR